MTTRPYMHVYSIEDLMMTSERLGSHFFDRDTMRAWNSTVSRLVRVAESVKTRDRFDGWREPESIDVLFITSERDVRGAWEAHRRYTVRVAHILPGKDRYEGRDIIRFDTVGDFGQYPNLRQAKKALRSLPLAEWSNPTYREVVTPK